MTIADSRVVGCQHIWAVGYGVPAYCIECGQPQEPDYKSLLAEAERKLSEAEIEIEQWKESAIKIENRADALQSRLDAVLQLLCGLRMGSRQMNVGQLLRAALGCATTGEGGT